MHAPMAGTLLLDRTRMVGQCKAVMAGGRRALQPLQWLARKWRTCSASSGHMLAGGCRAQHWTSHMVQQIAMLTMAQSALQAAG